MRAEFEEPAKQWKNEVWEDDCYTSEWNNIEYCVSKAIKTNRENMESQCKEAIALIALQKLRSMSTIVLF